MRDAGTPRGAWHLLTQLGLWLRPCFADAPITIPNRLPPWPVIVESASTQMIAPALGYAFQRTPELPTDASSYFDAVLEMNRERNARVLGALARALQAMNGVSLIPALLKGAAFLADDTYPDSGIRMIVDIDLLVPEPQTRDAYDALRAAGFQQGGEPTPDEHHHLPNLIDPVSAVRVEIHRTPLAERVGALAVASASMNGRTVAIGGGQAIVPPPIERLAHCVAHGQLSERRYRTGVPHLRQLLDVAMLRSRFDSDIDWNALNDRFTRDGAGPALADNLAMVEAVLGQAAPAPFVGHAAEASARTVRALNRSRGGERLMQAWWAYHDATDLVRRDPAWAVKRALDTIKKPFARR